VCAILNNIFGIQNIGGCQCAGLYNTSSILIDECNVEEIKATLLSGKNLMNLDRLSYMSLPPPAKYSPPLALPAIRAKRTATDENTASGDSSVTESLSSQLNSQVSTPTSSHQVHFSEMNPNPQLLYMVACWDGYVFALNLIAAHADFLIMLGHYNWFVSASDLKRSTLKTLQAQLCCMYQTQEVCVVVPSEY